MTFGEIYSRLVFLVWGNSTVPAGVASTITGDEGIIAETHKDEMRDENYWFMHETTAMNTVVDQSSYTLPSDYKEVIEVLFKANGEDYFISPMSHMAITTAQHVFWTTANGSVEYPTHFEISGDSIVIYPKPSEIRELHFCYWKFLTGPTTAFTDGTSTESNDFTDVAGGAIAYLAASRVLEAMDEFKKSIIYYQRGRRIMERLKKEDCRRRSNFKDLDYRSF